MNISILGFMNTHRSFTFSKVFLLFRVILDLYVIQRRSLHGLPIHHRVAFRHISTPKTTKFNLHVCQRKQENQEETRVQA